MSSEPDATGPDRALTSDPDANQVLGELVPQIRAELGADLIGLYLDGSLARGDYDAASDIDFVAVTRGAISDAVFERLQAMHDRLGRMDHRMALEVEGFYVPPEALHNPAPLDLICPNLERGPGERLKRIPLGPAWVVHQWILREHGVTVFGPPAHERVEAVSAEDLRRSMRGLLDVWVTRVIEDPAPLRQIGYLSYGVLSLCRILYTLAHGTIVSKAAAAAWALETLPARWRPTIASAVEDRLRARGDANPAELEAGLAFIRYAADRALQQG